MDRQKTYDTVKAFLLKQVCRSVDLWGDCMYRGPNGLKCAIGCLIPDIDYHPDMDKKSGCTGILYILKEYPHLNAILGVETEEDVYFLANLQNAHDIRSNSCSLEDKLKGVALSWGLKP